MLMAEPHRLGEIMRDIDRRGPGARDQRANSSSSSARVCASSADSGSSISRHAGRTASARAMPTRWRMPPESCLRPGAGELGKPGERAAPRRRASRRAFASRSRSSSTSETLPAHRAPGQQGKILEHVGQRVEAIGARLAFA